MTVGHKVNEELQRRKTFLLSTMVSLGAPAWFLCPLNKLLTGNKMKVTLGVAGYGSNYRRKRQSADPKLYGRLLCDSCFFCLIARLMADSNKMANISVQYMLEKLQYGCV